MARLWNAFTKEEADEFYDLQRRIGAWVVHCENFRKQFKGRPVPRDNAPTDAEFVRWNELWWRAWK